MPKRKLIITAIIFATLLLPGIWSYYDFAIKLRNSDDESTVNFVIETGQSVEEIAKNLERTGVIRSPALFQLYTSLSRLSASLQAGEYRLPKNLNLAEVVDLLQHGTFEERLTFIEGWRREEVANEISNFKSPPDSLRDSKRAGQIANLNAAEFLQETEGLEGYLFPDTYFVSQETTAEELVLLMQDNFEKKVASILDEPVNGQPNLPGITFSQVVVIASIVEREVQDAEDKPIVAGILIKRLLNDWRLQADATVQYALGYQTGEETWWKRGLTADDLKIESPYNTYLNPGLPPTPICNPGLKSLEATLYPKETDYWYYLSDAEGSLHFARTADEHNKNVAKYLR